MIRPEAFPYLESFSTDEKIESGVHLLEQNLLKVGIGEWGDPPSKTEMISGVFLRTSRSLDDAIECDVLVDYDLSHRVSLGTA